MSIGFIKAGPEIFDECAAVIRSAFITVADDFGLTKENAPTNPAFIETDALFKMHERNISMFAVMEDGTVIGFFAVEKAKEDTYYMEKLAVLPSFRHKGCGRAIMDYVFDLVRDEGGKKVSIGIINENTVLKNWYIGYGFAETEIKVFSHLPFTVCLMEKYV